MGRAEGINLGHLGFATVLPPEGTAEQWRSNGGAEPSLSCSTMRVLSRRNLRRKVETDGLLVHRTLNYSRRLRQMLAWSRGWSQSWIQNWMSTKRWKCRRYRFIREGRFQPVDRHYIHPVTQLKVEEFILPFQDQMKTTVERSQRSDRRILSHKNKLGT